MIAIILLVAISLVAWGYMSLVRALLRGAQPPVRFAILACAIVLPIAYPFLYKISPSFHAFKEACASERYEVLNSIDTDTVPVPSIIYGYKLLSEDKYTFFSIPGGIYSRGADWDSLECTNVCSNSDWDCVALGCVVDTGGRFEDGRFNIERTTESTRDFLNSVTRKETESVIYSDDVLVSKYVSYRFYYYGTGWAKYLGLASGTPPSISCRQL